VATGGDRDRHIEHIDMMAHEGNMKAFLTIYHHGYMEPVHMAAFEELYNCSFERASEMLRMCLVPSVSAFSFYSPGSWPSSRGAWA
jgi:hypothetical protein